MLDYINYILEMPASEFETFIAIRLLIVVFAICFIAELTKATIPEIIKGIIESVKQIFKIITKKAEK